MIITVILKARRKSTLARGVGPAPQSPNIGSLRPRSHHLTSAQMKTKITSMPSETHTPDKIWVFQRRKTSRTASANLAVMQQQEALLLCFETFFFFLDMALSSSKEGMGAPVCGQR